MHPRYQAGVAACDFFANPTMNPPPLLKEYGQRRRRLSSFIGADSVVLLPAAPKCLRSRDIHYPYRPSSDFFYLTGFDEANAVMVISPDRAEGQYLLFCEPADPSRSLWQGAHAGIEGACEFYGADAAYPLAELDTLMPELLKNKEKLYYSMGEHGAFDLRVTGWLHTLRGNQREGSCGPFEMISLAHVLHEMRLFKSRHEVRMLRKAAKLSAAAIVRAMRTCYPGAMEYHLEAEILYEYHRHGVRSPAYPPIVGCAENSCVLHYTRNTAPLRDQHLVLIDAGAELGYYASDITRTFPVNGRFSDEQRAVYEVVLAAQKAAIAATVPGNHWNDPHEAACRVITAGLVDLGILKGNPDTLYANQAYKPYYMHRTGHWLGMDVHDVGEYQIDGTWRLLEPGMVMTVEPGLYLRPGQGRLAKKWHHIGIRIEDDIVITRDTPEILSIDAPKEIEQIEQVMADPVAAHAR